jgi:aspartyl aminopeptidase
MIVYKRVEVGSRLSADVKEAASASITGVDVEFYKEVLDRVCEALDEERTER